MHLSLDLSKLCQCNFEYTIVWEIFDSKNILWVASSQKNSYTKIYYGTSLLVHLVVPRLSLFRRNEHSTQLFQIKG